MVDPGDTLFTADRKRLRQTTVNSTVSQRSIDKAVMKWNSLFLAVERLLRIIKDQGEGAIRVICTDLKVPMFNSAELTFLTEYAAAMSPG
ncbi:hypothetical protein AAFF_G00322170 [Aldrovandia affinis]|uniref:Uncharacterized protein n=1 Tax=Aldrovandia affinis TaxID=143900 RepID=A0AAD7SMC5_9TELE|nr:hypothetical protein AAFF_G00322170 [Aldrovandia affinis]